MKVIGITGGVGSGKSEVLRVLKEEFGAEIIMADQVAHQLMEPGKKGYQRVVEAMGSSILCADGSIDRKKLAALIFKDKESIEKVNGIIHPMVWQEIERAISRSDKELVVMEAALFDEERKGMFDELWYVSVTRENRVERLKRGRGYTEEKCREIIENQMSEEEYQKLADRVIDNNGAVEEIRSQLEKILKGN